MSLWLTWVVFYISCVLVINCIIFLAIKSKAWADILEISYTSTVVLIRGVSVIPIINFCLAVLLLLMVGGGLIKMALHYGVKENKKLHEDK